MELPEHLRGDVLDHLHLGMSIFFCGAIKEKKTPPYLRFISLRWLDSPVQNALLFLDAVLSDLLKTGPRLNALTQAERSQAFNV